MLTSIAGITRIPWRIPASSASSMPVTVFHEVHNHLTPGPAA
jgi:hypothetical protein